MNEKERLMIQTLHPMSDSPNVEFYKHNEEDITMEVMKVSIGEVSIKYGEYTSEREFKYTVLPQKNTLLTYNCLAGNSLTINHENLDVYEGDSVLFHEHAVPYEHIMQTNKENKGIYIETAVPITYFSNLLDEDDQFLSEITDKKDPRLFININVAIQQVLQQILQNPFDGKLAQHYLNSKLTELHILQYQNWKEHKLNAKCSLIPRDKEALHFIKEYIEHNYNKEFTLQDLALEAGINQTKLKVGFKTLFGTTTFAYLHDLKMKRALEMLESKSYAIYEVAEAVGYKHSHHFTKAFKKYFGHLPSQI